MWWQQVLFLVGNRIPAGRPITHHCLIVKSPTEEFQGQHSRKRLSDPALPSKEDSSERRGKCSGAFWERIRKGNTNAYSPETIVCKLSSILGTLTSPSSQRLTSCVPGTRVNPIRRDEPTAKVPYLRTNTEYESRIHLMWKGNDFTQF